MLHLLGVDHKRLAVKFQGLDVRLTGISGDVVKDILVVGADGRRLSGWQVARPRHRLARWMLQSRHGAANGVRRRWPRLAETPASFFRCRFLSHASISVSPPSLRHQVADRTAVVRFAQDGLDTLDAFQNFLGCRPIDRLQQFQRIAQFLALRSGNGAVPRRGGCSPSFRNRFSMRGRRSRAVPRAACGCRRWASVRPGHLAEDLRSTQRFSAGSNMRTPSLRRRRSGSISGAAPGSSDSEEVRWRCRSRGSHW